MAEPDTDSAEWQKFALDSVQKSISEIGKREIAQVGLFALLMAATSIVVLADLTDSEISLPIMGLKLRRWLAADVLLVLTSLALYRFVVTLGIYRLLRAKASKLMRQANAIDLLWIVQYPSFWWFHGTVLDHYSRFGKIIGYIPAALVSVGALLYFPLLLWRCGSASGFDLAWIIAATLSIVFVVLSLTLILSAPDPEKVIKALEETNTGET